MRRSAVGILALLALAATVPARAGVSCLVVPDRTGDVTSAFSSSLTAQLGGGADVDVTGFTAYRAGLPHGTDVVFEVGVADLAGERMPGSDASRFVVSWEQEGGERYTIEALRRHDGWSFAARRSWPGVGAAAAEALPVSGWADLETDTIRFGVPSLAMRGARVITGVVVSADALRATGTESAAPPGAVAIGSDVAPDGTYSASSVLALDGDCPSAGPSGIGATTRCPVLEDRSGDPTTTIPALPGTTDRGNPDAIDIETVAVASTVQHVVVSLDVQDLSSAGPTNILLYGVQWDLRGESYSVTATRDASGWSFGARRYRDGQTLEVGGVANGDSVYMRIRWIDLPGADEGYPLSNFSAWAGHHLVDAGATGGDGALVQMSGDIAPESSPAGWHALGGACRTA